MSQTPIRNFGGNVCFTPRTVYAPSTEADILNILDRHASGGIRVAGALHSWSPLAVSEDVLIDLRRFDSVKVERDADGRVWARVGGGCRIKRLLQELHAASDATLPSLGMFSGQTIAGAISTGTHGSGKHSLSHYVEELRIAAYDPDSGKARVFTYRGGAELRAARCALGCMGVILEVRMACVPKYDVAEAFVPCASLDDVLALESRHPLQQFYLVPHLWTYLVQCRSAVPPAPSRKLASRFYRAYWTVAIDVGMHLGIKSVAGLFRSRALTRFFFRHLVSSTAIKNRTFVDQGHRMLVMRHELFKHFDVEIFVPASQLRPALTFVRHVVSVCDDPTAPVPPEIDEALRGIELADVLTRLRGTFTHHYPICVRRVLPDDTLISMTADAAEDYYAIGLITYVEPRDRFCEMVSFFSRSMTILFQARFHWGKYSPVELADIERVFPHLAEFRSACRRTDPRGVFRNEFVNRVLGFGDGACMEEGETADLPSERHPAVRTDAEGTRTI